MVPQPEGDKQSGHSVEHQAPGVLHITRDDLQITCQHHEQTLAHDGGNTVERRTDAHEVSLSVLFESEHIEAVGGDVVGSTGKGHQPEESQRALQPVGGRDGEGYATEGSTYQQLHGYYPPALGHDDVDERAPQRLDNPRQIEPRGIKRNVCVAEAQTFIHNERDGHHSHIGQTFCEIEGGHPGPR